MIKKGLVIYEPKGRAAEYAPLSVNLYRGCGHGCKYCYAPDSLFIDPQDFKKAAPRADIIKKMERDIPKAAGAEGNVLLCFTCDPYQPINEIHQLTRQAIQILHANGFNVTILTKGADRAEQDFDLLRTGDEFATTLTFLDPLKSAKWEPNAALPVYRIKTLKKAYSLGLRTWVSLEPVIEPATTLEIIRETHDFVDLFKVGKLNYQKHFDTIEPVELRLELAQALKTDWHQFAKDVIATLEKYGCQYYIKKDLRRYL